MTGAMPYRRAPPAGACHDMFAMPFASLMPRDHREIGAYSSLPLT
jgi:hypothetical protein